MLKIQAIPNKDPLICDFKLGENLLPDTTIYCRNESEAKGSILLGALLRIEGISEIFIQNQVIKLRRDPTSKKWQYLAVEVGKVIRMIADTSQPLFHPEFFEELTKRNEQATPSYSKEDIPEGIDDEALANSIDQILQEQIAPGLAAHGGNVKVVALKEGVLFLSFGGGCQGCSQISTTLRDGVETILKSQFPKLKSIVDITEHEKGSNPFFS